MGLLRESSARESSAIALTATLAVVFVVLYGLVFPRNLEKELFLVPVGWSSLSDDRTGPTTSGGRFFVLGDREGFWDASGQLVRSQPRRLHAVTDGQHLAWYDSGADRIVVEGVSGVLGTIAGQKYPMWSGGRLYAMEENRLMLSSYETSGKFLWSRRFSSLISAVDASATSTVVGTLDGKVQVFDSKGVTTGPFLPGGSRLPVIFNVALSEDSQNLLVLAGVDPKRFLHLEKGTTEFRPVFHKPLQESKPWPTALGFLAEGKIAYHEIDNGLAIGPIDRPEQETILKFSGTLLSVKDLTQQNLVGLMVGDKGHHSILVNSLQGHPVLLADFQATNSFMEPQGNLLVLGLDQALLTLELRTK